VNGAVGGLPLGWEVTSLGRIAQVNPPLGIRLLNDDIDVTFVPMRAVAPEGGGLTAPEVRQYRKVKKGYTSFLSGDVVMAKITPCMENGKSTVVPEVPGRVCFGSTEFHVVRPESEVQARWISQFLLQHDVRRAAQREMAGGVGQMRVPASFLESLPIPVAPPVEQVRIVDALDELLSDLDVGVAALVRGRQKLKLHRASVLKAAVEGALTAEWRAQHPPTEPATELLKRILVERRRRWEEEQFAKFKSKEQEPPKNWKAKYKEPAAPDTALLPSLPEGWCWVSTDQVVSEVRNGYSLKPDAVRGTPILRISAVRPLSLNLDDVRYLPGASSEYDEALVAPRDLLFTRYNGTRRLVGVCAIVPELVVDIVHPDKIIRARPLPMIGAAGFFAVAANTGASRAFMEQRIRTTAGQAGISGSDIKEMPLPLPPLAEQEAVLDLVEDQISIIDHLEADLEARLATAQSLRQAILRHAFTGQLVPQDPTDEPASELLKRIAAERATRRAPTRRPRKAKPTTRRN
jgi:type I restriction enzyme S subunit